MTLGHVQSAQGHGWEVQVGGTAYWFGRGHSGTLLGAFASVIDLLDAFDLDNARGYRASFPFDLASDKAMTATAEASSDERWIVYALKLDGETVGFCVDTPDGALPTLFADAKSASRAAEAR